MRHCLFLSGMLTLFIAACGSGNVPVSNAPAAKEDTTPVFDVTALKIVRYLKGHNGTARAIALSPDGKQVAAAGQFDRAIHVWDADSGELTRSLPIEQTSLDRLAFSPDGKVVAAANSRGGWLWAFDTGTLLRPLGEARGSSAGLAYRPPDGTQVVTAHLAGTVTLWNASTGTEAFKFEGIGSDVWFAEFSHDGKLLASPGEDNSVQLWDVSARKVLHQLKGHEESVSYVDFSPDGTLVATATRRGKVVLWDTATGTKLKEIDSEVILGGLAFTPDGRTLAVSGPKLAFWDVSSGKLVHSLETDGYVAEVVIFSPDFKTMITTASDRKITVWSTSTE